MPSDVVSAAHALLVDHLDAPDNIALFLDIDGTLIDIAARPEDVVVADALPALLTGLSRQLGGALAVVSGRPISQIDALLTPLVTACAGGHGAQLRLKPGAAIMTSEVDGESFALPTGLMAALQRIAASDGRLRLEQKPHSLALHYRAAPELAPMVRKQLDKVLAAHAGIELLAGKMIYELKAPGFDKGLALARFMREPGFVGRMPIMIGDDVTDEAAFAQVAELGGLFFGVGCDYPGAAGAFENPRAVRRALAEALGHAISRALNA